ncbi:hypothetical protein ACTXT7_002021 [Hymenolepis weldensis]
MTHNPYLPCLKAFIDFPPFYNRLVSLISTSVPIFSRILTQVIHIKLSLFPTQKKQLMCVSYPLLRFLLISPLPQQALLSISLSVTRFGLNEKLLKLAWTADFNFDVVMLEALNLDS